MFNDQFSNRYWLLQCWLHSDDRYGYMNWLIISNLFLICNISLMTLLKFCVLIVEWSNVEIADSIRFMHCVNNIDMVFWMWLVNHSYEFVCKIMITAIGSNGYWNNKNGLKAYLVTMIPCDLVCSGWCRGTFWLWLYSILWKIG